MKKVFNMDEQYGRVLHIDGVDHKVNPVLLRDQIEGGFLQSVFARFPEKTETKDEIMSSLDLMKEIVMHYIPTLNEDDFLSMDMDALSAVSAYVRGDDPEDIVKNAEAAALRRKGAARETTQAE